MASTISNDSEIVMEIPGLVKVHKNGTVQRLQNSPIVPPTHDPKTRVSSKDIAISDNPSISARLYLPLPDSHSPQKLPVLVYFHGGGFFFESAFNRLHHSYFHSFLSLAHVLVVSVEYRLAPEHPLPAAYEDCWLALKWVASHFNNPTHLIEPWLVDHADPDRLFIGGDSSGGNIVHNIALRAGREALPGGVQLWGAFLSHPYFYGSRPIGGEPAERHEESVPFRAWNFVYPSAPGGLDNWMINPMAEGAPSLSGLGCRKMLVCVAEKDYLRERGVWYYQAVKKSGWKGDLELFQVEDEDHAFHIHHPHSPNAIKMIQRFADFLQ